MPRKAKSGAPKPRGQFGPLERMHLTWGWCGIGFACSLCYEDPEFKDYLLPIDMPLAKLMWEQHRDEILADWNKVPTVAWEERGDDWGWGWLSPQRIPAAGEVLFEGVEFPKTRDLDWPAHAHSAWKMMGTTLFLVAMHEAQKAKDVEAWYEADAWYEYFKTFPL